MLTDRFDAAFQLAHDLHRAQTRKGSGIPYISHLMAVAGLVLELGGTEDAAIAALLHDAVEDQGGRETLDRIRTAFGDKVADLVLAATDKIDRSPADSQADAWRRRKERDIAALAHKTDAALLIAACDKLHNLRTIQSDYRLQGEALWARFNGGRDGTLWYYRETIRALAKTAAPRNLVEELEDIFDGLLARTDGSRG